MEDKGEWKPLDSKHSAAISYECRENENHSTEVWDVLIVGAGPAGLSASLTAHQYGLNYLTLEQGEIASTIRHYPRHKFLMAEPIAMPLYGSLYIGDGTKESLLSVWETIVANTGVRVRTNERVESIHRQPDFFQVQSPKGSYLAKHVVMALGKRGTPRRIGAPGEELSKVSYQLIEAENYQGKDILVVGGGDSAVEAALALANQPGNYVTLSYRGKEFNRLRERNSVRLKESESQKQITVLRNSLVSEIRTSSVLLSIDQKDPVELANDYVFALLGGESPEDFLRKIGVEIVEKAISQ
jgi:thioredoxin reductase (NADPH)